MPPMIDHPSVVFTQDYKSLCRKRLTLFFEKGADRHVSETRYEDMEISVQYRRIESDAI